MLTSKAPLKREYRRRGGRPGLDVDFVAVCDATKLVKNGGGGTVADVARMRRWTNGLPVTLQNDCLMATAGGSGL